MGGMFDGFVGAWYRIPVGQDSVLAHSQRCFWQSNFIIELFVCRIYRVQCLANTADAFANFIARVQWESGNVEEATANTSRSLLVKDGAVTPDK